VLAYIRQLWESQVTPEAQESAQVQRLKKFMNFIGEGVPPAEQFLHEIRRVATRHDFFRVVRSLHLDHDRPISLEPVEAQMAMAPARECPD
jgi:tRNA-dihydrouridine synthase B